MQNLNPIVTAAMQSQAARMKQAQSGSPSTPSSSFAGTQPQGPLPSPQSSMRNDTVDPNLQSPSTEPGSLSRARSDESYRSGGPTSQPRSNTFSGPSPFGTQTTSASGYGVRRSPHASSIPAVTTYSQSGPSPSGYVSHQNFPPLTQLPPPVYATMSQAPSSETDSTFAATTSDSMQGMQTSDGNFMEGMTPQYAIPMFGGEGYSRSPFAMADDFTAWLFNDSQFGGMGQSPMTYHGSSQMQGVVGGSQNFSLQAPYFTHDPIVSGYFQQPAPPPQHPMAVHSLIDTHMQQMAISEERRRQLMDLIEDRFTDKTYAPVKKAVELLDGNDNDDNHVLSLHMMQIYIGSYWLHFHPQWPILHKPTFSANTCPELLLLAIMALGASCLEKTHGYDTTQSCAELSNFLAWHLRWEIFMDADFRPPAKLWVFQALLLLEVFEKMYSSRPLHERAHIHHATTLTLMRRGSSLIGRSSLDSPPSGSTSSATRSGSINGALSTGSVQQPTADEWWSQWIANEATRRAAFAAFLMDSIHATMFGHSAVMVAHEMRLPLPCDEALWSATSSAEVGRVEQSLHQNGIKPATFLDGLKKTLNGQPVRTNAFGRTILMAGLLSVSWHMNQRDLQVSSLGVQLVLGGRDKWRGSLTRAFDFWRMDFDESLSKAANENQTGNYSYGHPSRVDDENVFESRTVLHHLAHMAMHVDIVDCQIYAGASRLLGRSITPQDYNGAQKRMKDGWAPTARARDATFYALRFLSKVLLGDPDTTSSGSSSSSAAVAAAPPTSALPKEFTYSARDDYLINRPWVLYFATLIVWSYGYALDGPITPLYSLKNDQQVVEDMQGFLRRVGGVRAPDDLAAVANRNACLGLLMLMRDTFANTRWELLHEAGRLLNNCIGMLSSGKLDR